MTIFSAILLLQVLAPQQVRPVLEFPEPGLDDPAAYEGYQTRFLRDARGNAFQIYINQQSGRVVHLWANAANESAAFTVREAAGQPARVSWGTDVATVQADGRRHTVEHRLQVEPAPLEVGWFMLGTMRVERDFQYQEHHLRPYGGPGFERPELLELIANIERLEPAERRRQLELLNATSTPQLRERLEPRLALSRDRRTWLLRAEQPSFDGRNRSALELLVDRREADVALRGQTVSIRPRVNRPITLTVRATTDAEALTPLRHTEIFNEDFLHFHQRLRGEHERLAAQPPSALGDADRDRMLRFRRLDRQIRSVELLSYHEKLMAGLPNFATYFGRDMLMSALMMQPIWTDAMSEHVVATVLRKLAPSGEVSHEEALGGQAIRENAVVYNTLVAEHLQRRVDGDEAGAAAALEQARAVLGNLQAVRENWHNMMDDDFQFPVFVARYLANSAVSAERKREFLLEAAQPGAEPTRLRLLMRNLAYVVRMADPYVREPAALNLISFPQRGPDDWFPGSWRDSNAGYANGRFAMDINVIWVPLALDSVREILAALGRVGFDFAALEARAPELRGSRLADYARDPELLDRAVGVWRDTDRHFTVRLEPAEARARIDAKLASLPEAEGSYWRGILERNPLSSQLEFLALSLDAEGRPIPVVNTDPATRLFLEDLTAQVLSGALPAERVLAEVRPLALAYPLGVHVSGLGPLVSNDAYASPVVWRMFENDHYHSPRVVWGREVNLLLLALAKQINAAFDVGNLRNPELAGYVAQLHDALQRTRAAVEASGLKHNELWSYRIEGGRLFPVRYATSTDIQLWNLTDLAVQYELARIPASLGAPAAPAPAF